MPEFMLWDRKTLVTVDEVDADLMELRWHVTQTGKDSPYYIHRTFRHPSGKWGSEMLHRVIKTRMEGRTLERLELVDHWDRNPFNNSRGNLRLATHSQNLGNTIQQKNNTSGFKGVTVNTKYRKRFTASIAGKLIGRYTTPEEAHAAYCKAAVERYGEFANFGYSTQDHSPTSAMSMLAEQAASGQ